MEKKPNIWARLGVAFGLSTAAVALVVTLYGRPTWGIRFAAMGAITLTLVLVVVWHWGFSEGVKAARR